MYAVHIYISYAASTKMSVSFASAYPTIPNRLLLLRNDQVQFTLEIVE